jgi:hypothetical protein
MKSLFCYFHTAGHDSASGSPCILFHQSLAGPWVSEKSPGVWEVDTLGVVDLDFTEEGKGRSFTSFCLAQTDSEFCPLAEGWEWHFN